MLNQRERWILFYETLLKPYPEDADYIYLDDVINQLKDRWEEGLCVKKIKNETAAIRISDMKLDNRNKAAIFLFQYSDKNISDPAFSDLDSGELRVEPKLEGEGVAVSAHMIISLEKKAGQLLPKYISLLEDVPGIGRTKIEPFLQSELRQVSKGLLYWEDENGAQKNCRPMVEISGMPSQTLKDDLERGVLAGLELRKTGSGELEFDEPDYIKETKYNVILELKEKTKGSAALRFINSIKKKAKSFDYNEIVIRYKREGKRGKQKSVAISTAREDAGDALYAQFEIIKTSSTLPQCSSSINNEVVAKMLQFLPD